MAHWKANESAEAKPHVPGASSTIPHLKVRDTV